MARGLSDLQWTILRLAARNADRSFDDVGHKDRGGGADTYYSEILVTHYGWCPEVTFRWESIRQGLRHGDQKFSPQKIGRAKYNAGCAAVSRAALRLRDRGLVRCVAGACSHWSGVTITDAGLEILKRKKKRGAA